MSLKAILFDLDGTLLDSVPTIMKCNEEVFTKLGLPFDPVECRNCIGIPLSVQAIKFAGARADEFTELYRNVYRRNLDEQLFPGTLTMLDSLKAKGYITGLVTSKAARGSNRIMNEMGLSDKFDVVVTADDVTNPKPHPEPILKALEKLKLQPGEALYVGDSLFDVDCAQRASVPMVAVSWGARSKEDLLLQCPDHVFDSWDQFLNWINR